jgi:hypothetical protein
MSSTPPPASAASTPSSQTPAAAAGQKDDNEGGHAHSAPHGGSLIEFGDEFAHLELVLDAGSGRLTAYALDGEAERPVRLAQPAIGLVLTVPDVLSPIDVTLTPVENALTGEKAGDTSQFAADVPTLKGRKMFRGSVTTLTIRGQSFARVGFEFPATQH